MEQNDSFTPEPGHYIRQNIIINKVLELVDGLTYYEAKDTLNRAIGQLGDTTFHFDQSEDAS